MNDLSVSLVRKISDAIDKAVSETSGPLVAAFDADGTLWDTDMGENFFFHQIEQKLLKNLPPEPWEHYLRLKKEVSPQVAYLWLAQINAGQPLTQVRKWSEECVKAHSPLPIFNGQKKLIDLLHSKDVKVYVVTASIKWSVEPAAAIYGIPPDRVLGITTKIDGAGLVTTEQDGPITWREGKVEGLLRTTSGIRPFFCSGNTPGDLALLESATHVRLAMAASNGNPELFEDELRLVEIAKNKGWFYHLPVSDDPF